MKKQELIDYLNDNYTDDSEFVFAIIDRSNVSRDDMPDYEWSEFCNTIDLEAWSQYRNILVNNFNGVNS